MGFDGLPEFVVSHLKRIAKDEGFIGEYHVNHASGSRDGDGFSSTSLSITLSGQRRKESSVDLEPDELTLICKLQPSNATHKETFGSEIMFEREVYMYNKLLPALDEFQKKKKVPKEVAFFSYPKCYVAFHNSGNRESVIILEDLRTSGFEMWNKLKQTDFEVIRLLMEQLGRFHGLSFAIRDQNPDLFKEFQDLPKYVLDIISTPGISSMFQSSIAHAISLMDNPQDVESLTLMAMDVRQIFCDGLNEKLLGKFGVVIHADCWINNMMFKFDQGSAKTITMLDWQCSRVSSPAVDLTYFLFSATVKSLRDEHLTDFLQIYYSNLAGIIRATGSDPDLLFPEPELHQQLRQFGKYGVMMAPIVIPVNIAVASEISNIEELTETMANGKNGAGLLTNLNESKTKQFAQRMKDVLADARQYGWL